MSTQRSIAAEFIGTALLLAIVVGSGIMGEQLAGGNVAIALLANAIATGAGLYVLILVFGSLSGAHFNPAVSALMVIRHELPLRQFPLYVIAQIAGAICGVMLAHAMFNLPLLQVSSHLRGSIGERIGEVVATCGLLLTILGVSRARAAAVPSAVALYITSAYWFTSSTSFANPAVTLARALTATFAGIAPASVAGFIAAQGIGLILVCALSARLWPNDERIPATTDTADDGEGARALPPTRS